MAVAAQTLIRSALRLATVTASGETPQPYEEADALITLNDLLSLWSLDPLLNFEMIRFTVDVTSSAMPILLQASTVTNPALRITTAQYRSNGNDTPLGLMSEQKYQDLSDKTTAGTPSGVYVDRRLGPPQLYVYPVPSVGSQIILTGQQPLTAVASLVSEMTLQPGYESGLRYNLAVLLAGEYGKQPPDTVVDMAMQFTVKLARLTASTRIPRQQQSGLPIGDVSGSDSTWIQTGGF